jgi:hypothetical protein
LSAKKHISEAFGALLAAGKIDFSNNKTASYPAVRAWLAENYPQMVGVIRTLSDEPIRQATKAQFEKGPVPNIQ